MEGRKFEDFSIQQTEDGKKTKVSKIAGKGKPVVILIYSSEYPDAVNACQALEDKAKANDHVKCILLNVVESQRETSKFLADNAIEYCESYQGKISKIPSKYGFQEGRYPYHIVISEEGEVLVSSWDTTCDAFFDQIM